MYLVSHTHAEKREKFPSKWCFNVYSLPLFWRMAFYFNAFSIAIQFTLTHTHACVYKFLPYEYVDTFYVHSVLLADTATHHRMLIWQWESQRNMNKFACNSHVPETTKISFVCQHPHTHLYTEISKMNYVEKKEVF